MSPESFIGLLEELIDLKVQGSSESHLKTTPELTRLLQEKRETDRRRLAQIRSELVRILSTGG